MTNAYIRAAKKHPKLKQQAAERLIKHPDRPINPDKPATPKNP
jgi:hypothetical protein